MKREIDIHGMMVSEARSYLKKYLNDLPKSVTEVEVIHGFHKGQNLQKFVRKEFNHKFIAQKIIGFNNGSTTILIKR